jgi:sterol desaturase/sphingolipid hydroxylase (fatty acid hydroxylase superfamily)
MSQQSGGLEINPVAYAIPIFLVAIILEAIVARRRRRKDGVTEDYYFGTALSDLTVGTVFQGVDVLFQLITFSAYVWLFNNYNLVDWGETSWAKWTVAMLGVDLMFYWWHRASHVINFMWAVHGVHHQSEDFNLAVALRQPLFEPLTWFFFYAPLAFLGVDPLTYLAAYGINRFYQFWIHTELVDKLGPLEWVLNTPSHHRVHHGVQDQYLDKNYGAILIIWDFIFRSFEKEEERVIYGTTTPLRSYNPVWANFAIFARIGRLMREAKTPLAWVWAPFAHPAWLPGETDPDAHLPKRVDCDKYRPRSNSAAVTYVAIHFLVMGVFMFFFLLHEPKWSIPQLGLGAFAIVAASMAFCGIIERRPWAWPLEIIRLSAFVAALYWMGMSRYEPSLVTMVSAALALGSIVGLLIYGVARPKTTPSSGAEHHGAE